MEIKCGKCLGQGGFVDYSEEEVDGVNFIICKNCNGKGYVNLVKCKYCDEIYRVSKFCCPNCQQQDFIEEW